MCGIGWPLGWKERVFFYTFITEWLEWKGVVGVVGLVVRLEYDYV